MVTVQAGAGFARVEQRETRKKVSSRSSAPPREAHGWRSGPTRSWHHARPGESALEPRDLFWTALALLAAILLWSCGDAATPEDGAAAAPVPNDFLAFGEDGQVVLSWGYPDDTLQKGAHVYWGLASDTAREHVFVAAPRTRFHVDALENGTEYSFALELEHATGLLSGRSEEKTATPVEADREAPEVRAFYPASGELDVAQDAPITVVFSEVMAVDTLAIRVLPPRAIAPLVWDHDTHTLVVAPAELWAPGTRYLILVDGRDTANNALVATASVTFTTGWVRETPLITAISPHDGMMDVPLGARVSVTFDEPMNPASVASAFEVHPSVDCIPVPDTAHRTFTCTPSAPLSNGTLYGVLVRAGAQSERGRSLAQQKGITFGTTSATATTPPSLASVSPASGAVGVPRAFELVLRFDHVMDQPATQAALAFPSHPGLDGTFTWSPDGRALHFVPALDPQHGAVITWTLDQTATDMAGHALEASASGTFQIVRLGRRTIESVAELDGTVAEGIEGTRARVDHQGSVITVGALEIDGAAALARGFVAFDLAALPEELTTITFAALELHPRRMNAAFELDPGLVIESFDMGFELNEPDYVAVGDGAMVRGARTCPASAAMGWRHTITPLVARDWAARDTRAYLSSMRLRLFSEEGTTKSTIELAASHPWVPAEYRPKLYVEYEVP